jgi:transposase
LNQRKAAQALGVDDGTVINWIKRPQLMPFFSEKAKPTSGRREISDQDFLVLNTIRVLSGQGVSWDEIAEKLGKGERISELPPQAATTDGLSSMIAYGQAMTVMAENEKLQQALAEREDEIKDLQRAWREDKAATTAEFSERIGDLKAQIRYLEGEIKRLKGES